MNITAVQAAHLPSTGNLIVARGGAVAPLAKGADPIRIPPPDWVELAAATCETCDGKGFVPDLLWKPWVQCPACGGSGKPWIELWAPCPTCGGSGTKPFDQLTLPARRRWATRANPQLELCDDCPTWTQPDYSVLVARVQGITILPVVHPKLWKVGPESCVTQDADGTWWWVIDGDNECHYIAGPWSLDPLPSPGVDYGIAFEKVELA